MQIKSIIKNLDLRIIIRRIIASFKNIDIRNKIRNLRNHKKEVAAAFAVVFLVFILLGLIFWDVLSRGAALKQSLVNLETSAKMQDFPKLKTDLVDTKIKLNEFDHSISRLKFLKYTPFVGVFAEDATHFIKAATLGVEAGEIVVEAVEPYADMVGFKGVTAKSETETTQERIDFIVKAIPELIPKSDQLIEKARLIKAEIDKVDPNRYPEKIGNREVRSRLKEIIELMDQSLVLIENSKPMLEVAPYLLGVDGERKYLVLFQNDKELRPTGGFWTAYTIGKVNKGRFEPSKSSDIYDLDSGYTPSVPAPEPIIKHLKGPYIISKNYRLRDMNWSPDFKESVELFMREAKAAGMEDVDGVIAVDTEVLVNILDAIGPIDVPGFGKFGTEIVSECNCPQVIYELESFADVEGPIVWSENEPGKIVFAPPNYDDRKKIIGPLMNSILSNSLGQPPAKMPLLVEAGMKSLTEKHVLFYLFDEKAQKAVEDFGIAGTVKNYEGDYLYIVDSNLGGRKSNLYVKNEVSQELDFSEDGKLVKTLTLTYKNPEKYDGWLNSVLPNYVRVYVPEGSELISFSGVEYKEEIYNELGKTVFAGFFQLRPLGVAKLTLKYKVPISAENYKLFIQKQPGTSSQLYTIKSGKKSEEFYLKTDKEVKLN